MAGGGVGDYSLQRYLTYNNEVASATSDPGGITHKCLVGPALPPPGLALMVQNYKVRLDLRSLWLGKGLSRYFETGL